MTKKTKALITGAAITGLFAGYGAPAFAGNIDSGKAGIQLSSSKMDDKDNGDKHACKGQNDCKGKGGCKSGNNDCKGQNDCKGKGGCNTENPKK